MENKIDELVDEMEIELYEELELMVYNNLKQIKPIYVFVFYDVLKSDNLILELFAIECNRMKYKEFNKKRMMQMKKVISLQNRDD